MFDLYIKLKVAGMVIGYIALAVYLIITIILALKK